MLGTLKTGADLSRLSFKAFMSRCFEASPVSPTSATQSSSALSLLLSDEPPRLCDPSPTAPGGCYPRAQKKPGGSTAAGRCFLLADLVFAGTPIQPPLRSGIWLSPVTQTICYHTNHPVLCKSTLDWEAQLVLPCAAMFHFCTMPPAESRGTESQTTEHRVKMR